MSVEADLSEKIDNNILVREDIMDKIIDGLYKLMGVQGTPLMAESLLPYFEIYEREPERNIRTNMPSCSWLWQLYCFTQTPLSHLREKVASVVQQMIIRLPHHTSGTSQL